MRVLGGVDLRVVFVRGVVGLERYARAVPLAGVDVGGDFEGDAELLTVRDKYDAATNPNSMEYYKYFEKTNPETNESTTITYSNTTIE